MSSTPPPGGAHIVLPPLRGVAIRAGKQILETTVAPTAAFWLLLHVAGLHAAVIGALTLNYLLIGRRLLLRRTVPVLLIMGTVLLTSRTAIVFATGSTFLYFLQPTLNAYLVAGIFGASALAGRPIVRRLSRDFIDLPSDLAASTAVETFFREVTLLWTLLNIVQGSLALYVLATGSIDSVLIVRGTVSPVVTLSAVAASAFWGARMLRREGFTLGISWQAPVSEPHVYPAG
ncbi:MAG: VC0807 family protein [Actinomycetes bacterium]